MTCDQGCCPREVLDLFSGAGGAAMGLHRAWPHAHITGVDIVAQKRYPFDHVVADAMTFALEGYDFIWASPPCQAFSTVSGRALKGDRRRYPRLIEETRRRLRGAPAIHVMENVPGAPLAIVFRLCGSSFGLDVRRHRYFESNVMVLAPSCNHSWQEPRFRSLDSRRGGALAPVVGVHGHLNYAGERELRQRAMGIDWMDDHELTQAIPPAYAEYIARQLTPALTAVAA